MSIYSVLLRSDYRSIDFAKRFLENERSIFRLDKNTSRIRREFRDIIAYKTAPKRRPIRAFKKKKMSRGGDDTLVIPPPRARAPRAARRVL